MPFRTVGELFLEVADVLRDAFTRATAAEGLTFTEGRTLRLVRVHGEQARIVADLDLVASRVSALLRSLEAHDLIVRTQARGDKRHRDVRLTEAGEAALQRIHDALEKSSPLMTALDDQELDAMTGLLEKMRRGSPSST